MPLGDHRRLKKGDSGSCNGERYLSDLCFLNKGLWYLVSSSLLGRESWLGRVLPVDPVDESLSDAGDETFTRVLGCIVEVGTFTDDTILNCEWSTFWELSRLSQMRS